MLYLVHQIFLRYECGTDSFQFPVWSTAPSKCPRLCKDFFPEDKIVYLQN